MTHADDGLQLQLVWPGKDQCFCQDCRCLPCGGTFVHQASYIFPVAGYVSVSRTSHVVRGLPVLRERWRNRVNAEHPSIGRGWSARPGGVG